MSVAVDSAGDVYVADTANSTIRGILPNGLVTTLAGAVGSSGFANGIGSQARFSGPFALTSDISGTLFIADTGNNAIRMGRNISQTRLSMSVGQPLITTQPVSPDREPRETRSPCVIGIRKSDAYLPVGQVRPEHPWPRGHSYYRCHQCQLHHCKREKWRMRVTTSLT